MTWMEFLVALGIVVVVGTLGGIVLYGLDQMLFKGPRLTTRFHYEDDDDA